MSQKGLIPILIVLILAALVGGYLVYSDKIGVYQKQTKPTPSSSDQQAPLVPVEKEHPKLESSLYQLAQSNNRQEFAKTRGLDLINSKVRVEIELVSSDYTLPSNFGTEETRYQNQLQALVLIDKLLQLADDPNIKSIRSPGKPILLNK